MPTQPATMKARKRLPAETMRKIGRQIRYLRESAKPPLDQGELAARAGINVATLNQIENGHRAPDLVTVLSLATQLSVLPSTIIESAREAHSPQGTRDAVAVEPAHLSAAVQAATTAGLADLVTAIVTSLADWLASHHAGEAGGADTGTRGRARNDRG